MRGSIAALLIAFPVFAWLARLLARELQAFPAKRFAPVRRWLTYLTLFFAATALICDMTALVYNVLGGELGLRFVLKVGVVALVAIWYAAASPKNVTAQCTDSNNVIVDDDYCDESYYRSHGGYSSGGFIYIGGSSYRYNYGGSGVVGQKAVGGSYTIPKGANVTTKSGTSVQRGGFGISSGSSSSGG